MSTLKFLGATVLNYNSNVGYNNQESTLDLSLVEDPRDGDIFALTAGLTQEGHPTYFEHGAFFFGGIIRNWVKNYSAQGLTYTVSLADPRIFFDGITLIINDYTSETQVPNVINVYGYLEQNFGGSNKNEAGVKASTILQTLMVIDGSAYTGGISYYGINYYIDISGIPFPPDEFRLSSTTISFADFLNEIAEVTSSTFTSYLYLSALGRWTIGFNFSSRSSTPVRGAIGGYIALLTDPSVKNNGVELVNEVTTKMLFGGNKTDIYLQNYADGYTGNKDNPGTLNINSNGSSIDNPIYGYYGRDLDGNLAIPQSDFRNFAIDARNVKVTGIGSLYYTNDDELRAALSGIDIWQAFLVSMWPYEYIQEKDGKKTDYQYISVKNTKAANSNKNGQLNKKGKKKLQKPVVDEYQLVKGEEEVHKYRHNGIPNPHFKKAYELKMGGMSAMESLLDNTSWGVDLNIIQSYMNKSDEGKLFLNPVETLFELVSNFASENHGRKFTVKVPEIKMTIEPDTGLRRYDVVPTDGGYLDASSFESGVQNNLIPYNIITLTLDDNRLSCYVRFDDVDNLDLSEIGADNIVFNQSETSAFIRCDLEPEFAFVDYRNAIGARAVITLPGRVTLKNEDKSRFLHFMHERLLDGKYTVSAEALITSLSSMTDEQLIAFAKERYSIGMDTKTIITRNTFGGDIVNGDADSGTPALPLKERTSTLRIAKKHPSGFYALKTWIGAMIYTEQDILAKNIEKVPSDMSTNGDFAKQFVHPSMAAIPLLSNVLFYGPWISSIGTGKTDVVYDPNLVPWNFNGFDVMNSTAEAKINEISGNLTWSETGSIDIPGIPICSLGEQLINSGPYVSDISVSIGTDGFITSYKMSSWTPRFNKISNAVTEKLARITKTAQAESRVAVEKFRIKKRSK